MGVAAAGAAAALPTTQAGAASFQVAHCPHAAGGGAHKRPQDSLRSAAGKTCRVCHRAATLLLLDTAGHRRLLLARAAVAGDATAATLQAMVSAGAPARVAGLLLLVICPFLVQCAGAVGGVARFSLDRALGPDAEPPREADRR